MKCPNCNNEIPDNTKFCPECGVNVTSPQATTPQQTQPMYNQVNLEPPKKKLSLPLKIVIGIVGCIIVFSIIGSITGTDETTTTTVTSTQTNSSSSSSDTSTAQVETPLAIYQYLSEQYTTVPFTVSDKAQAFLLQHPDLFPAKAYIDCESLINYSIMYKHLAKNAANYGDTLVQVYGEIVQIGEISKDKTGLENDISTINMIDYDGNQYYVFYYGTLDLYLDDTITMTGLPLDMSSFDNTDGGSTLCPVIAGAYVEKDTSY